jgi:cobalt/nickel transport protein
MDRRWWGVIAVGLGIAVVVALFSPWASSRPDGLERVAEDEEFLDKAKDPPYEIIADYVFPGIENEKVATILSGLIGIAIVAGIGFAYMYAIRRFGKREQSSGPRSSG